MRVLSVLVPLEAHAVSLRARWDDCDGLGHVNNSAYAALLRDATELALGERALGRLASLRIAYRVPVAAGSRVEVALETTSVGDELRRVDYAIRGGGALHAEASIEWCLAPSCHPSGLPPLDGDLGGKPFRWRELVRTYEVGPDGDVRASAILQWLEHAVFRAALRVGWDAARIAAADVVTLQIGHHLVRDVVAGAGDEVVVTSRLVEMRRASGTWHHEVRRVDGSLVAADRSRGAFIDGAGRIRAAPRELIDALLGGEPDD